MHRLILFRHAKAEGRAASGEDFDRDLTERGRRDARLVADALKARGIKADLALVSGARRTRSTWDVVSVNLAFGEARFEDALYCAPAVSLLGAAERSGEAGTVLVLAHNPGLHDLAVRLIASGDIEARERVNEKLPTSGLVVIDLPFDDWSRLHANAGRLERFVTPRLIDAASD